jgi:hypothetical protein
MYKYPFLAVDNIIFSFIFKFIPVHEVSGEARQSQKNDIYWKVIING